MEPSEVADTLREMKEEHARDEAKEHSNTVAAIVIAIMAMLLAITSLGGQNAMKEMINSNIQASDTWAFYQAKNIRQTSVQLAADDLDLALATQPNLSADARATIQKRIDRLRATAARYESEPSTGEGKTELQAKARQFEQQRAHAQAQDPNFDFAEGLFQIAIVLGSVSVVVSRPALLGLAVGLSAVAFLLMLNGFFLFVNLPFG